MDDNRTARVLLRTDLLALDTTNAYGTSNAMATIVTFTNLNLKTIMGFEMYEAFDTFNLSIENISNAGKPDTYLNTTNDPYAEIRLSGLNFLNSTYDHNTNCLANRTSMCIYEFPPVSTYYNSIRYVNLAGSDFAKSSDIIDLTISLVQPSNGLEVINIASYPDMSYMFVIRGVTKSRRK